MFIDTHCHLNFEAFQKDWQEVLQQSIATGVEKMIVVGTDIQTSEKAIEMAKANKALYATVGLHPHHAQSLSSLHYARVQICQITDQLKKMGKNKQVVAIGECGLDYHVYKNTKYSETAITPQLINLQKQLFGMQIQLAKDLKLPLIIHSREAGEDTLDALDHFCKNDGCYPRGVFHCISGSKKLLQKILKFGFYVGVDANITYSQEVQSLAKLIPLNRLLLETDSPYLSPSPHKNSRNTPSNINTAAKFFSQLTHSSIKQIEAQTTKNAFELFQL
jgi:TatD DNase family protein